MKPKRNWRAPFPGLSPWHTLVGLLTLAQVRAARGDRAGGRVALAKARAILEAFPDAGVFPELLERQERRLRTREPRDGRLDEELTERGLAVLRLLPGEQTTRLMAESLYVAPRRPAIGNSSRSVRDPEAPCRRLRRGHGRRSRAPSSTVAGRCALPARIVLLWRT